MLYLIGVGVLVLANVAIIWAYRKGHGKITK